MIMIAVLVGILLSTTLVDDIKDPMITDGKIHAPVIVRIQGSIGEGSADSFMRKMLEAQQTGQPVIPIVISSYGGSVYSLFKMVDIINKVKQTTPVATIVIGKAMSAGAVLLSCGSEGLRFASPTSTIMIHEVSSGVRGKMVEIKADSKEGERINQMLLEMISTNIGKKKDYISNVIHKKGHADWFISPKQAKRHGIINHIGIPDLKIKASVEVVLE